MKDLKTAFNARKSWHNNRSSTVFPCFPSHATIHYLVFQDYWSWKSGINPELVKCIIRLYDSKAGDTIQTKEFDIRPHNCINLNKEFEISHYQSRDLSNTYSFEIDIISTCNLGFPFPGIMLFCVDEIQGEISCVHSGGRRLNTNESKYLKKFTETNWLSIQNEEFTPFFHIFNDSTVLPPGAQKTIQVSIKLNGNEDSVFATTVNLDPIPFASKLFYIQDIFPRQIINELQGREIWIEVELETTIFPRMIVGNYDLKRDFHYITHSFGRVDTHDYVKSDTPKEPTSFLPLLSALPLKLQARSYPTNSPCRVKANIYEYAPNSGDKHLVCDSHTFETRGNLINLFETNSTILRLYEVIGECPSRLNVSYNYSLTNSRHPTDIATGFKSKDYPPKHSHWGHGVCMENFCTLIFIRNNSQSDLKIINENPVFLNIELFCEDSIEEVSAEIPASGWNYIKIDPKKYSKIDKKFFSWRFKDHQSSRLETFWVSFNLETGAICGEHGF